MTRRQRIAAVCGLAGVLGLATIGIGRAQHAEPKEEAKASPRKGLRERIVTLRTEVEVLELERDAIRSALLKILEGVEQGEMLGIDVSALMGTAKLELGGLSGNAESLKEMSDLMKAMESDNKDESLSAMKKAFSKQKNDLQASVEKKKQELVRKVRALHEKKFDLDESEERYKQIR